MGVDVLEYIVRMRGAQVAAAEARGLARSFDQVAVANQRVTASGTEAAAASRRGAGAMALMTKASRVGALSIAAIGFEAVKSANTFDTEMLKIRTDAGASSEELRTMRGRVLDLAKSGRSMGQGPQSLAMGLYHLESLGIRGTAAIKALQLASEASAISGADLEETTSALGAAMYVGIEGTTSLTQIMATLNATVGQGNMRMGDLVHALGTGVLPAAKLAGLSIQDVMAALAVFSDSGQNASSAAAQFATALHFITNPTTKAQGALAQLHMTQDQLAQDMRKPNGMVTALKDLRSHLDKLPGGMKGIQAGRVLGAIFPGGRGRVLQTELVMLDRANSKFGAIMKNGTAENWRASRDLQKRNPATVLATAWSKAQAELVDFGTRIRPLVMPVLAALLGAATAILHVFAAYPRVPVIGFIALLTLGFLALFRASGRAIWSLGRFALGMPKVVAATEAQTAATAELTAATDASAVSAGAAATKWAGFLRFAGPAAAFLYGTGLLNPDTAGLDPKTEGRYLDKARKRAGMDDSAGARWRRQYHDYTSPGIGPQLLEQDLERGLEMGQAHRNTLNRYYRAHNIRPPKLLGPIADPTPGRRRGQAHEGDIVVKIDGREIARATRKQAREQQARG